MKKNPSLGAQDQQDSMMQTSRSVSKADTSPKQDKATLWPYLGIEIPGIGYEATTHANAERNAKDA